MIHNKTQQEEFLDWAENQHNQREKEEMKQIVTAVVMGVVLLGLVLVVALLKSQPPAIQGSEIPFTSATSEREGGEQKATTEKVDRVANTGKDEGGEELKEESDETETRTVKFISQRSIKDREVPGRIKLKILKGSDKLDYVLYNEGEGTGFTSKAGKIQSGKNYRVTGRTSMYRGKKQFSITSIE